MPAHRSLLRRTLLAAICTVLIGSQVLTGCSSRPDAESKTPPTSASTADPQSSALIQAIRGIDAAVYAYGVVGAHVRGSLQPQAARAIRTLERQRAAFELSLGSTLGEAAVAYALPTPVTGQDSARALAELLEMKLIPLFDEVAKASTGATSLLAVHASRKAAQRAERWGPGGSSRIS